MSKINSLTDKQIARFPEFVDKWTRIGLCIEPADRCRAENGIRLAYKIAGLVPPERIVWCGSPLASGITRFIVRASVRASVGDSVWDSVWASVRDSVRDSVGDSVWDSVWDSVGDSVGASVGDSVGASVGASVRASVRASVGASVGDSVGASVWASVRDSVGASVWASVGDSVRDSVWASVGASVWDSVWDSVGASVWDSVGASVWDSVWASVGASVGDSVYGQHDASYMAFCDYLCEVCCLKEQTEKIHGMSETAQSANWWLPHKNICWVSERHNAVKLNGGRLHCDNGPALSYPDGWSIWSIDGILVDKQVVESPETQTIEQVGDEKNSDRKSIRIQRFGWPRYLKETGSKCVDSRENKIEGTLEALYLAPDGSRRLVANCPTGRVFAMGCPPEVQTCEQAQSWLGGEPLNAPSKCLFRT